MFATRFANGIINFFLALTEIFLGLRFLLRFFAANPNNAFVNWIFNSSDTLLQPFRGIFPTTTIGHGFVVDFSTLFAMAIYAVFAILLTFLVTLMGSGAHHATKSAKKSKKARSYEDERVKEDYPLLPALHAADGGDVGA
jgi:uncharacterized protein YggT (Ycf19 family)